MLYFKQKQLRQFTATSSKVVGNSTEFKCVDGTIRKIPNKRLLYVKGNKKEMVVTFYINVKVPIGDVPKKTDAVVRSEFHALCSSGKNFVLYSHSLVKET